MTLIHQDVCIWGQGQRSSRQSIFFFLLEWFVLWCISPPFLYLDGYSRAYLLETEMLSFPENLTMNRWLCRSGQQDDPVCSHTLSPFHLSSLICDYVQALLFHLWSMICLLCKLCLSTYSYLDCWCVRTFIKKFPVATHCYTPSLI